MAKKRKTRNKKINLAISTIILLNLWLILKLKPMNNIENNTNYVETSISLQENEIQNNNVGYVNNVGLEGIDNSELQVYYIDVGQADSILILNNQEAMLIDAGNNDDGDDVVEFLKNKSVSNLKYVVGTHPHEDHIGGLDDVIKQISVENVMMPDVKTTTLTYKDVVDAVAIKNLQIKNPQKGEIFNLGNSSLEVMTECIKNNDSLNLSSIVLRLTFKNQSFLFMGDAETENEKTRFWPQTDVLKVGHHGSNTSTSESFIKQVNPKISIIMVGKANKYNLPKDIVINRIKDVGSKIYRTDEDGSILVKTDGNELNVSTHI